MIQDPIALEQNKRLMKKNLGDKISSEATTRHALFKLAKLQGSDGELRKIMERYDKLLAGCSNQKEQKQISIMGIAEIHRLLNVQGALVVDGVEILPALKEIED